MASVNPDSDFSSPVLDITSPAIASSNRDLSLIPDGILEIQMFSIRGQPCFQRVQVSLLSEFYVMMTQAKLKFEYPGKVKLISTCLK